MQGHYDMDTPTGGQVKVAARRYSQVAGAVMLTELDLKASSAFDGTEEDTLKEYRKQYWKYKEIYQGFKELCEEGVDIRTVTVWGVIDGHSWLQTQNNVGGASNGKGKQCPLLFDDNYKAKPLFYALCGEEIPQSAMPQKVTEQEPAEDTETVENEITENETAEVDASEAVEEVPVGVSYDNGNSGIYVGICAIVLCIGAFVYLKKKKS